MRTTLDLPEHLVRELCDRSGARSKTTAIVIAMQEYVDRRRAAELYSRLAGRVRFAGDPLRARHAPSAADRARLRGRA